MAGPRRFSFVQKLGLDACQVMMEHVLLGRRQHIRMVCGTIVTGAAGAALGIWLRGQVVWALVVIPALLYAVADTFTSRFVAVQLAKQAYEKRKNMKPQLLVFSEIGLERGEGCGRIVDTWDKLYSAQRRGTWLLLYLDAKHVYPIDLAEKSGEEQEQITAMLREKLGERCKL